MQILSFTLLLCSSFPFACFGLDNYYSSQQINGAGRSSHSIIKPFVPVDGNRADDSRTAEAALFQAIMGNYRSNVRPVRNLSDTVYVTTRLFPIKIQTLKERDEILSLTLRLQLGWSDRSLVWNPVDYGGIDKIVVNAYDLWLPDLQIANSAEDMYQLMRDRQFAVKIHHNGEIWWHPTGSVKVRCELDLRNFPFDLQRCPLILESVIHTVQELNLTVRQDRAPISFSMYTENGVWELVLATGAASSYFVSANTAFSRVQFLLYLHRRTSYYKLNIIFPCAMLSGLQLLTFLLPLNNQERVPQSTTILLSVVVFQTVVVEELPRTSNSLSLLSMYISMLTGISVVSVADSVAIAYLISLRDRAFQVPRWLAVVLRCVCRNKPPTKPVKAVDLFNNSRSSLVVKSSFYREGAGTVAPLAYLDDYGDVHNSARSQIRSRSQHQINAEGGPWSRNGNRPGITAAVNVVNQQQCIAAKLANVGDHLSPGSGSIGNGNAHHLLLNDDSSMTSSPQRGRNAAINCPTNESPATRQRLACQQEDPPLQSSTLPRPYLHEVRQGNVIVYIRWYKVARIINAIIFSICLLLIIFLPIILFVWMPPDVSHYKYFMSPSAASPSNV